MPDTPALEVLSLPPRGFALQMLAELTCQAGSSGLVRKVESSVAAMAIAEESIFYVCDEHALVAAGSDREMRRLPLDGSCHELWVQAAERCLPLASPSAAGVDAALPVLHQSTLVGVLAIRRARMPFHAGLLEMLGEVAAALGAVWPLVVEREQAERLQVMSRDLLVQAVERLEPERQGRVARLSRLVSALCDRLDLSRRSKQLLWEAVRYLDLGRVALAGQPQAQVDAWHALRAAEILRTSQAMAAVADLVARQDEPYDQGPRKSVEAWVLGLCVDLERAFALAGRTSPHLWLPRFVEERGSRHHHAALEALDRLHASGMLSSIYEGSAAVPG